MSYDITIKEIREVEVYENNYTYNVSPMFREALGGNGINHLDGKTCLDAIGHLEIAVNKMKAEPDKYKAMNPKNNWGDYKGALKVLEDLLASCKESVDGTIYIS